MAKIIVESAALVAVADAIDHEVMMMGFSDEETASDDWDFSGPRIQRAADELRTIIKKSEPVKPVHQ